MSGALALLFADEGYTAKTYVEDVFSTYTYTGTGSAQSIGNGVALADSPVTQAFSAFAFKTDASSSQKIRNGLNMAAGALLWLKDRGAANPHFITDTVRGANSYLRSNATNAAATFGSNAHSFSDDGFTVDPGQIAGNSNYIAWCFAKKAKFMDIVTWTGDGTSNRQIAHALGIQPGMIIIKSTTSAVNWLVCHRSIGAGYFGYLNTTDAFNAAGSTFNSTEPTASNFTVGSSATGNAAGQTYVAYIFAHDTASDGMIQCGSFTTDGSGNATVNLGWRPQFLLSKRADGNGSWVMVDTTRGWQAGSDNYLVSQASNSEASFDFGDPTATGFTVKNESANANIIYMAIRAPEASASGGGMVWSKCRSGAIGSEIVDTLRGGGNCLQTVATDAQVSTGDVNVFTGSGYSLRTSGGRGNNSGQTYVSWTFKRAPKFFDVVTYTGNGNVSQTLSHLLGQTPGMIVVKKVGGTGDWTVWHRSLATGNYLRLNDTSSALGVADMFPTVPTATQFTIGRRTGDGDDQNASGIQYVAYLFAHDSSADGLIQCGSFTAQSGAATSVNLGWEPQVVLWKMASGADNWEMLDTMRGWNVSTDTALYPNTSGAETSTSRGEPTATGFTFPAGIVGSNQTYIYLAIRRGPMRKPKTRTEFHSQVLRNGTGAVASITGVGFPPDLMLSSLRSQAGNGTAFFDRLRGPRLWMRSPTTESEFSDNPSVTSFDMSGVTLGTDNLNGMVNLNSSFSYIYHFLRRMPGVLDLVCFTTTGNSQSVNHNLGVVPEMIITKSRNATENWRVLLPNLGRSLFLNQTSAWTLDGGPATATQFSPYDVTNAGRTYVAILFATLAGLTKCFSYTGNGSSQTIPCGFSAGASFILIKRTDSTGDWYIWSSSTGIVAGSDPHLSLNTTAAEVSSDDSVDPDASGFIVNQLSATNINVNGASYIGFAIAA